MTNKLLLTLLLCSTSLLIANDNIYKGCGENENEARINLANNISTKIESTTSLEKSNSSIFGFELFSKTFKKNSKQTSNLSLKNVQISNENDKVCATIDKDELFILTKQLITKIDNYNEKSLPKYEKDKVIKLNEILSDIKNCIVLSEVYQNVLEKDTTKNLQQKQKYFLNLRKQYHSQFVKITIIGDFSKLEIDNIKQNHNKELFLKSGNHKFKITSSKYCEIEKEFTLNSSEDFETIINMDEYNFPYIIVDSNKKDAVLSINNENKILGDKHIFKNCDGTNIPYWVTYNNQKENGNFTLNPNESLEKSFIFYSNKELSQFNELSKSYEDTTRLEIKYGYMGVSLSDDYEDFENINTLQVNLINTTKAFRYGFGAVYGQSDNSTIYELYYNIGLQLSRLGETSSIRLGPIVMIPSLTAQIGVGYHELYDTKNELLVDRFPTNEDIEENNFSRDYGVLKTNFGIDFIVNKSIGINIFAQKQFTMEKSTTFGAGLSLGF
ncbi:MAG: hypothetical protein U9N59_05840 [Campylobacterota bacterium]|nr:hypothetical protein [Campylobacterota bacterium]